jgi:O-antigen/teichoic acid export membrane protein
VNSIKEKWGRTLFKLGVIFKMDAQYIFSGSFWLAIEQAFAAIATFALALAFAHLIPKETYGNYKFVFSIAAILSSLTLSGLGTVIVQTAARNQDGFLKKAFLLNLSWSSLFTLAMVLTGGYYYWNGNPMLAISIVIAGLFAPLLTGANFYDPFLIGKKAFRVDAFLNGISVAIPAAAITAAMFFTQNYILLILTYYLSNTFANLSIFFYVQEHYARNNTFNGASVGYSKHLSLMNVFSALANNIDQILVFHYLGAASLAVYAFATAMPEQLKGIIKNVSNLAMPKFSERTAGEINATIWKKIIFLTLGVAALVLLYILLAPLVFRFFFPKYLDSLPYSQVYALSLIMTIGIIPSTALQAQSAKKELYASTIYSSLLQIVLIFGLVYVYGLWGVVWARIITRFTTFLISARYWRSYTKNIAGQSADSKRVS